MAKTKKTPLELMREIRASDKGEESNHCDADDLLCRLVRQYVPNGRKIVEEYHSINKWYA
jgi:hypothetical protein